MTQPIQTADFWNDTADGYVASVEPFTARFCEDAVELAGIEPGMTVLDVAAGPGALALAAARAGARVTAIDFSQAMVDRLVARSAGTTIEALRMDGQALDLPSDGFDRVCSVFGIPLFPDWRAGLVEMARVLKPGGRAVLGLASAPYGFGPNQLLAEARQAIRPGPRLDIGLPGMMALSDADLILCELAAVGLEQATLHSRTHQLELPENVMASESPMIRSNPLIVGLESAAQDAILAEANRLADRCRFDGVIRMPGTAHIAVATKP